MLRSLEGVERKRAVNISFVKRSHTKALYLQTLLLIDRMYRIDRRCHLKYGVYWEEYCKRVPYLLIPYVL